MNLALTRRGDYAVRAALCLAKSGGGRYVKIREVAQSMALPASYTPRVLRLLAEAGLAEARAGREGGYRLTRPPGAVALLEVVEAAEGPFRLERCILRGGPCHWEQACAVHGAWAAAVQACRDSLRQTTLADLAAADAPLGRPPARLLGVVLATLITFPLTFGWLAFFSDTATGPGYTIYVLGFRTVSFDALSFLGWVVFHGLDLAAVLVLAGCGWFLWRRFRHREATTGQRFGYDFFPLIGLVAISVTGLLLTFSSWLLEGRSYDFLAIAHMATVVLTLVFIPFGKFFHVIQRPASVGVEIYKRASLERDGVFCCRRCGEPLEARAFVDDLKSTMDELELGFSEWAETCPRCKRVLRGRAYLDAVKRGFR